MVLNIAFGVPDHFIPKAKYALQVLLAPYDVELAWVSAGELANTGGLYYGSTPFPEQTSGKIILGIESLPSTWAYFERFTDYDFKSISLIGSVSTEPIPVLFGSAEIDLFASPIRWLHSDIVASAFYWLSSWQDFTRIDRDAHGRHVFRGSLHQKLNLHTRAVVDEYSELLHQFFTHDIPLQKRVKPELWSTVFSHDIDRIKKRTPGIFVRETLDFLILNRNKKSIPKRITRWGASMRQFLSPKDAYRESILKLLHQEKQRDIQGSYLLKSIVKRHKHDANDYLMNPFVRSLLAVIDANKAEIGYHSGYEAGNNPIQLRAELNRLSNRIGRTINVHRSHYLRYDPAITFTVLEELGIKVDSSIAWAEQTGFRSQTCRPFPIFNIAENRSTGVIEVPLAVMDTQPFGYMKLTSDDAIKNSESLIHTVRRHNGVMVWNFHHHIYDPIDAPGWHRLLDSAFEQCETAQQVTFEQIYDRSASIFDLHPTT